MQLGVARVHVQGFDRRCTYHSDVWHETVFTKLSNKLFSFPLDVSRISDGQLQHVYGFLKVFKTRYHTRRKLASHPVASDPRSHGVPMYATFQDPTDEDKILLVMPVLREYFSPPFDTMGEVVEFLRQVFKLSSRYGQVATRLHASSTGSSVPAQTSCCTRVSWCVVIETEETFIGSQRDGLHLNVMMDSNVS
jgi:hypothetical protein